MKGVRRMYKLCVVFGIKSQRVNVSFVFVVCVNAICICGLILERSRVRM